MQDLFKQNQDYWINRAPGYSDVNKEELTGIQKDTWSSFLIDEIDTHFNNRQRDTIKILDVGAGPGFLSIIMAKAGYQVTAFDFAETMIAEARSNAGPIASQITFVKGDAMDLPFEEASFDVVISRNLTWNLPDPKIAYVSWLKVLKPQGLMMVFDANWYGYLVDESKRAAYDMDRAHVKDANLEDYNIGADFDRMEEIALNLPMTREIRPKWDEVFLNSISAGEVTSICDIGSRLYSEKEMINYSSTPLFMVRVVKG